MSDDPSGPRARVDLGPLLDQAGEAFFVKDLSGRYLYINAMGARMLSRTPDHVLGRTDADIFLRETADQIAQIDRTVVETEQPYTYQPTRHDFGEPRVFQTTKYPYLQGGEVVGVMGVSVDVTELVAVHERTREVEARLVESDRLATVGTLAAGVAHEVNSPLYVVQHRLERLEAALADDSELLAHVREARRGADRVARIVRDLTSFARPGDDPVGAVDLHVSIEQALQLAAHLIRHRARVERELSPVPRVHARAGRLGQVLLNLIVNAARAVPVGSASEQWIRVSTTTESDWVVVQVEDSGPGVPAQVLPHVFDRFFTTKPAGCEDPGLGLGLWLCRRYVDDAGGEISLHNAPLGGAVATVRLRASAAPPQVQPSVPAAISGNGSPLDIVVVDDDPAIVELLCDALSTQGVVRGFGSVADALPAVLQASPDVIVCDLMMPDQSGMDLHAELARARPALASRMLFLTGGAFTAEGIRFVEVHRGQVLPKPLRMAELLRAVRALAVDGARGPGDCPP